MFNLNEDKFVDLAKNNVKQALQHWVNRIMEDGEEGEDVEFSVSNIEDEFCETIGTISLELVDEEGGFEGGGEHVERTFAFKQNDVAFVHFQITGFYSSWNGTDWNSDIEQVYPHRVMTTVWKDTPQQNPPKE